MQVILKERVAGQGNPGNIINVKRGYARNYLFPQGLALPVCPESQAWLKEQHENFARQDHENKEKALNLAAQCEGVEITLRVSVKENNALYGSIGVSNITEALQQKDIHIARNLINIQEGTIKMLGDYHAVCQLHDDVVVTIPVHVVTDQVDG
jgi:large subunit ribosomal protein L9